MKTVQPNQCTMIMDYIERHPEGITDEQARESFGCHRLAARIKDLRDDGHKIETRTERGINRYGKAVKYARYVLVRPEQKSLF